jgi:hypothetical protein
MGTAMTGNLFAMVFSFCWKQVLLNDVKFPVPVYQGIKYTIKLVATIAATMMIVTNIPFFVVRFFFLSLSEPPIFTKPRSN